MDLSNQMANESSTKTFAVCTQNTDWAAQKCLVIFGFWMNSNDYENIMCN